MAATRNAGAPDLQRSSTDDGQTWSGARVLNSDDTATDQPAPGIDVGPNRPGRHRLLRRPPHPQRRETDACFPWQDTRNADPTAQPEDVYMAKLPMSDTTVEAATSSAGSALLWSLLGTGAGLAVAGVVLVVGLRRMRRAPVAQTVTSQR